MALDGAHCSPLLQQDQNGMECLRQNIRNCLNNHDIDEEDLVDPLMDKNALY